jgi:hypothetical protein
VRENKNNAGGVWVKERNNTEGKIKVFKYQTYGHIILLLAK